MSVGFFDKQNSDFAQLVRQKESLNSRYDSFEGQTFFQSAKLGVNNPSIQVLNKAIADYRSKESSVAKEATVDTSVGMGNG